MMTIHEGQCGLCTHFGEHHEITEQLQQVRVTRQAPEDLIDECGHPEHSPLNLRVTPISGCDGFEAAIGATPAAFGRRRA